MASGSCNNGVWLSRQSLSNGIINLLIVLLNILFLVTADPGRAFAGTVRNGGSTYDSFQAAYAAAATGAVLKSQAMTYPEGLFLNRGIAITVQGGYDPSFSAISGATTINGPLIVGTGSVIVENLIIAGSNTLATVPNVVGQSQATAQGALIAAGLAVGTVTLQNSTGVPTGAVISQNPLAGASVAVGTAVNLVVSSGTAQVTVPNVVGQTTADVQTAVSAVGMVVGTVTQQHHASVPTGRVISQSPSAGTPASPGAAVSLAISSGPAPASTQYVVVAWNDLGMHCLNPSYDTAVILPPYNTIWAQVIRRGTTPQVITSGISIDYRIINNTTSVSSVKGTFAQFWDPVLMNKLFGTVLTPDTGLNLVDPNLHNSLTGTMVQMGNHYQVNGIPVTPVNDFGVKNPYQVAEITVKDTAGTVMAQTLATVPTSDEFSCGKCHFGDDPNPFVDMLIKHDRNQGTKLNSSRPVLCASCHGSPALNAPLTPGIKYLSQAIHGFHARRRCREGRPSSAMTVTPAPLPDATGARPTPIPPRSSLHSALPNRAAISTATGTWSRSPMTSIRA